MINGETTVTYTPIKGRSMYNISTYGADTSATGSTMPAGSSQPTTTSILWTYPGGITNKKYSGTNGLWGYLLSPQSEGGNIATDTELTAHLIDNGMVDHDGNILNMEALVNEINSLVSAYFVRVLKIEETPDNLGLYGLQAFKNNFEGCYRING